jgi:hypothetical protein
VRACRRTRTLQGSSGIAARRRSQAEKDAVSWNVMGWIGISAAFPFACIIAAAHHMLKHPDQPSLGAAALAGIAHDRPAANRRRASGIQTAFVSVQAKPPAGKRE